MKTKARTWIQDGHILCSMSAWVPLPPEAVFAYVSDFSRHHEWARNALTITALGAGPAGVGSKYRSVARQAGKDWASDLEITGYEPPSRFEFTATGGPLDSPVDDPHRHEYRMRGENGGTLIELRRSDPKPPDWSPFLYRLLAGVLARATLNRRVEGFESLRAALEQQSTRPFP